MCTNDKRKQLLAHGNRHFRKDERYCNDERYLKLWMSYVCQNYKYPCHICTSFPVLCIDSSSVKIYHDTY